MAKGNHVPGRHTASGYSVWPTRRTISEAENVARWNPWLAHAWMNEALDELSLERPFFNEYDDAVARINARWQLLEQFHWFNVVEFWKLDGESFSPTYLALSTD